MYIVEQVAYTFLDKEIKAASYRLNVEISVLKNPEKVNEYFAKELYSKVDVKALVASTKSSYLTSMGWVSNQIPVWKGFLWMPQGSNLRAPYPFKNLTG